MKVKNLDWSYSGLMSREGRALAQIIADRLSRGDWPDIEDSGYAEWMSQELQELRDDLDCDKRLWDEVEEHVTFTPIT